MGQKRHICIHGHFYQPPRENPWLEAIELQDSASPYHDWNERITAECYAPNQAARILDGEARITQIINNYSKISFNFGPTLLSWMVEHAPDVYKAVLKADRESRERFSGHGSALAQVYNHMILPLANRRDKYTQVLWGIQDFEHRFGRRPEGMWLPETGVDLETLDILAEFGIGFTVLAPHQARRVRPLDVDQDGENDGIGQQEKQESKQAPENDSPQKGGRERQSAPGTDWEDVTGDQIDTMMPYRQRLPSGRTINIFFYDHGIAHAVAFEGLLSKGEDFAGRLVDAFSEEADRPQLVHIATDGESYGHHHRQGEMALAYALHYVESNDLARLTNYGEYLEEHPPTHEVQIVEDTSWSCAHGIERWRSDCGCNAGRDPGWDQAWRAPLRDALDWLRDALAPRYEKRARRFLRSPWEARNDYFDVVFDRSPATLERFLTEHALRPLDEDEVVTVLKLLELQRHAMLMYTSCGWFFDELSGIETVQVIQYAGRAVQLAQELLGDGIESRFLDLLRRAKSNIPGHRDGRRIYEKFVEPAQVDLTKVGAHYALSSLFEAYEEQTKVYCYAVDCKDYQVFETGRAKLGVGQARVSSESTHEAADLCFGVLHFGRYNLQGGAREMQEDGAYEAMVEEVRDAFSTADFPETIRVLDRHFGKSTFSLRSLFRDEQRKVSERILESSLKEVETEYRQLYEDHAALIRFLADLQVPLPKAFEMTAEFVLNTDLRRVFEAAELDLEGVRTLLEEAENRNVQLEADELSYALRGTLEEMAQGFREQPDDLAALRKLEGGVGLAGSLPFAVNLWQVQNIYYEMLQTVYPRFQVRAEVGHETAREWIKHFEDLGARLSVRVD